MKKQINYSSTLLIAGLRIAQISLVLIFSMISSCKKDEKKLEPEPPHPSQAATSTTTQTLPASITIDSTNSKMKITQIPYNPNWTLNYFFDLDGDSVADILVKRNNLTWHGLLVQNSVELQTLNDDIYILTDSIYTRRTYDCNSTISTLDIDKLTPRGLVFNDQVNVNDQHWRKGNFTFYYFDQEMDTLPCHKMWVDGDWYLYTSPRYVAVKFKGKLGWLKLRVTSAEVTGCQFFEYALYKE